MVFNPTSRSKRVADSFPVFTLCNSQLAFVDQFTYLGHIIDNSFSDDSDINREVKALFARTSLLCRWLKRCSKLVKVGLFRSFCVCFYDTALWCKCNYSVGAIIVGLPRVTISVWNTFLGILSTVVLQICCLSWDSQASTLWYTTIMLVLLTGCQRATMFLFNVFCSWTCNVHGALHAIFPLFSVV